MQCSTVKKLWLGAIALAVLMAFGAEVQAQHFLTNPYRTQPWGELPEGREWGATSAVFPSPDGNIWVAERCGQNSCVGSDLDPVLLFDTDGNLLRSFGAGQISWPHGIFVEPDGSVWITDATIGDAEEYGLGHSVMKFSPEGELLLTLGTPGEAGDPPTHLNRPSDVVVSPTTGHIYVAEAHGAGGENRIVRFDADGNYIETWGETGYGPGQFHDPHNIAMDSQGRIFVADRSNVRIQIFDEDGEFIAIWTQFGRPSGLFIDQNDVLYVADSESSLAPNQLLGHRGAGWERGIRVGDARTGWVYHFIPDDDPTLGGTSAPEGVAVDQYGNVYGAEVGQRRVLKHHVYGPIPFGLDRDTDTAVGGQ